jgi:hypothetical protein
MATAAFAASFVASFVVAFRVVFVTPFGTSTAQATTGFSPVFLTNARAFLVRLLCHF